jgi:hypothetical protein
MAVIAGFTRLRKRMWGKQSAFGTPAVPTRVIPWRGVPVIDPNWADDEDADVGSIDPALPPVRTQTDITIGLSGTLNYQDAPALFAGSVKGGVASTGGGAAKTWDFQAVSLTATAIDNFTEQFTDDVTNDAVEINDIIIETWELSYGDDQGPWQLSAQARGASFEYPIAGGPEAISLGSNFTKVYGADTELYINDTSGAIGTTKISDALHSMSLKYELTVDQKRFSNGSNTRFQINGYGISARVIGATFTFAKTAASLAEVVKWLNADPVNRFIEVRATSPVVIPGTASTHYSLSIKLPGTWRTRSDGEQGGNATIALELAGQYNSALGYPFRATVVNDQTTLP